jgi:hypothetical protein
MLVEASPLLQADGAALLWVVLQPCALQQGSALPAAAAPVAAAAAASLRGPWTPACCEATPASPRHTAAATAVWAQLAPAWERL